MRMIILLLPNQLVLRRPVPTLSQPRRSARNLAAGKLQDPSSGQESDVSSVPVKPQRKTKKAKSTQPLGSSAVCVPLIPDRVAARKASGCTQGHELDSSRDAAVATNPACHALTAEILKMLPKPRELFWLLFYFTLLISISLEPKMKCSCCMTVKNFGESMVCEFRGLGRGCGACYDVSATWCSFELNPAQVDQMVNELFCPWQHLTLSCSYFLLFLCSFLY